MIEVAGKKGGMFWDTNIHSRQTVTHQLGGFLSYFCPSLAYVGCKLVRMDTGPYPCMHTTWHLRLCTKVFSLFLWYVKKLKMVLIKY